MAVLHKFSCIPDQLATDKHCFSLCFEILNYLACYLDKNWKREFYIEIISSMKRVKIQVSFQGLFRNREPFQVL